MDKVKMIWSKTNRWHRGILIFIIIEMRVLPVGQSGFTCNDPALSHKFAGDTVNMKHLFGTILLLPLATILLIERKYHRDGTKKPKKQALRWYKEYIFGLLLNLIAVQGIKIVVGAPRPHFFDTCQPNEAATCQGSEFVPRYTCSKPQQWSSESSKSFPSGHTSLAVHAGVFLAVSIALYYYLYRRAARSTVVAVVQSALLVSTVYCAVSRMLDHRHHWWDVLGGAAVALPILVFTIFYLCRNFEATSEAKEKNLDIDKSNDVDISSNIPKIDANDRR